MHCSHRAREFLHFRPISAHPAGPYQVIESTLLFDFLHLLHFLLPPPAGLHPLGRKVRASTALHSRFAQFAQFAT